jgi:hypothetical protein
VNLSLNAKISPDKINFGMMTEIRDQQWQDDHLMEKRGSIGLRKAPKFEVGDDDIVRCKGRICVPNNPEMSKLILDEGQRSNPALLVAWYEEASG